MNISMRMFAYFKTLLIFIGILFLCWKISACNEGVSQKEIVSSKTPHNDGEIYSSWFSISPLALNSTTHYNEYIVKFRSFPPKDTFRSQPFIHKMNKIQGSDVYRLFVNSGFESRFMNYVACHQDVAIYEKATRFSVEEASRKVQSSSERFVDIISWYEKINAPDLNRLYNLYDVRIAVLDTGIDLSEAYIESIKDCIRNIYSEMSYANFDLDTKIYQGWSVSNNSNYIKDTTGHGSEVSSILYMLNPLAQIIPVKINQNDKSYFTSGDVIEGLYRAKMLKADIVNMSLSGPVSSQFLEEAVLDCNQAGMLLIAAAPHSGADDHAQYPACYPQVIGVAAEDGAQGDREDSGSQVVHEKVAAPGFDIGVIGLDGQLKRVSGSSYSTAIVSGVASRLLAQNPYLLPQTVKKYLTQSTFLTRKNVRGEDSPHKSLDCKAIVDEITPHLALTPLWGPFQGLDLAYCIDLSLPITDTDSCLFMFRQHGNNLYFFNSASKWELFLGDRLEPAICLQAQIMPLRESSSLLRSAFHSQKCVQDDLNDPWYLVLTDANRNLISPVIQCAHP